MVFHKRIVRDSTNKCDKLVPSIDRTIFYLLYDSQGHHLVKQVWDTSLLKHNAAHWNCFFVEQNMQKTKKVHQLSFSKLNNHFQIRFQKILIPIVDCMPPSSRQSVTPSRQILPVLWVITVVRVSPRQKDHTMTDTSNFCPKIMIPFFTLNTVNLWILAFIFRKLSFSQKITGN